MKTFIELKQDDEIITIITQTPIAMEKWLNFIGVMAIDARNYCIEKEWKGAAKEYDEFIDKILGKKLE